MTRTERLLSALEVEITNVSKLEHVLARTRVVLREHATRLRLGEDPEMVMTVGFVDTSDDGGYPGGA